MLDRAPVAFAPLADLADQVRRGIVARQADQHRPGSHYLKHPPLTTREQEWLERSRLCLRLLEMIERSDSLDLLSPTLSPALVAMRAIVADSELAAPPRV